jgi:acyl-CoA synthetase (AMP-forming)/AMP-acid ligase II
MSKNVDIGKLHFKSQHAERVYLNEERVRDRFTLLFGAISTWVSKAGRGGTGGIALPFIEARATVDAADEVTYDITSPIAQVMLIRTVLAEQGMVRSVDDAKVTGYVQISGESCLRHPSVPFEDWHTKACVPGDELEAKRAQYEMYQRAFSPTANEWLLTTLRSDGPPAAGFVSQKWLDDGAIPRWFHQSWTTFGLLQERVGAVPLIAPMAVFLDYYDDDAVPARR